MESSRITKVITFHPEGDTDAFVNHVNLMMRLYEY